MGLAASQARYLTLTARKSDLEFQSQTINSRRIQLSYKTAEIARAYSEAMNNKKIQICTPSITEPGKNIWQELTFSNLLKNGFVIIGSNGAPLHPSPYILEAETTTIHNRQNDNYEGAKGKAADIEITRAQYDGLSIEEQKLFTTAVETKVKYDLAQGTSITPADYAKLTEDAKKCFTPDKETNPTKYTLNGTISQEIYNDLKEEDAKKLFKQATVQDGTTNYKLKNSITADEYNALPSTSTYKEYFSSSTDETVEYTLKTNPYYNNSKGTPAQNIQSLLTSGRAQIVSREFFDYLVKEGCYTYGGGIKTGGSFEKILEKYKNSTETPSIYDWRSDETENFQQRTYTEDDEKAIAEYEAATAEVQGQDKILEMEAKQIETQHKAIETELESVKKVVQKHIEDSFKIFS